MIQIWKFHEAPTEYQTLSSGGDEEWLMFVPVEIGTDNEDLAEKIVRADILGCCTTHVYTVADGKVYIGYHA